MLGTVEQKFFTVKDIPAADFIRAYADFLKKNNKLERPAWVDYAKTGKSNCDLIQPRNWPPMTTTGSTLEWLRSPARSTSDPGLESDFSPTSTEARSRSALADPITTPLVARWSVGVSNSSRSSRSSRRVARLTSWRSTPESSPGKASRISTVSPLRSLSLRRSANRLDWSVFNRNQLNILGNLEYLSISRL